MHDSVSATRCPACGATNQCALASDPAAQDCWCMHNSAQLPLPAGDAATCYCPTCLQKIAQQQTVTRLLT